MHSTQKRHKANEWHVYTKTFQELMPSLHQLDKDLSLRFLFTCDGIPKLKQTCLIKNYFNSLNLINNSLNLY